MHIHLFIIIEVEIYTSYVYIHTIIITQEPLNERDIADFDAPAFAFIQHLGIRIYIYM
jgi:hypothetical protein